MGGNGHCSARLALARPALAAVEMELVDVAYPGFEGRPRAEDLDGFLGAVSAQATAAARNDGLVYATGIGGLIALCLRARSELLDSPLLLQAPVLWGLQRRLMPRLMRHAPVRAAATRLFASPAFQRRFVRRYFTRPPSREMRDAFFEGYAGCAAFADLFEWFGPSLLRHLEADLAGRPEAARRLSVWWGGRDRVVTPDELRWTEAALGTTWPLRLFPEWGHYPMIDDPEGWARALREHAG